MRIDRGLVQRVRRYQRDVWKLFAALAPAFGAIFCLALLAVWGDSASAAPPGVRRFGPYLGAPRYARVVVAPPIYGPAPYPFIGPGYGGIYGGYFTYGPWTAGPWSSSGWYGPGVGYYYSFGYQPYVSYYNYDSGPLYLPADPALGVGLPRGGQAWNGGGLPPPEWMPPPEELPPPKPDGNRPLPPARPLPQGAAPQDAVPQDAVPQDEGASTLDPAREPEAMRLPRRPVRIANEETRARAWRLIRLGDRSFSQGRFSQALEHYGSAVQQAPDVPEAHLRRGQAYTALGRLPNAAAAFKQALLLRPELEELKFDLRNLYGELPLARTAHLDTAAAAAEQTPGSPDLLLVVGVQKAFGSDPASARPPLAQAARRLRATDAELASAVNHFVAALPSGGGSGPSGDGSGSPGDESDKNGSGQDGPAQTRPNRETVARPVSQESGPAADDEVPDDPRPTPR